MKKEKPKSRTRRWEEAISDARAAFESVQAASEDLALALSDLRDVQSEYEDWQSNLPENLQQSAVGEKLDAICDLDIDGVASDPLENWSEVESILDEAEGAELPLGFGRD